MTLLDELHYLLTLTRLHIYETHPHIKAKGTPTPAVVTPKPVQPAPLKPTLKPQAVQATPKVDPPLKELAPPPVELALPEVVLHPVLSALCRPFELPAPLPLSDCIEKLEKLNVPCHDAHASYAVTEPDLPKLLFVSFFGPGSGELEFLQKVAAAVTERRARAEVITLPELAAQAEIWAGAAAKSLKGVVLAYNNSLQPKVASFCAAFGAELHTHKTEGLALPSRRQLFSMPFYELVVPEQQDATFKSSLWKALQQIV